MGGGGGRRKPLSEGNGLNYWLLSWSWETRQETLSHFHSCLPSPLCVAPPPPPHPHFVSLSLTDSPCFSTTFPSISVQPPAVLLRPREWVRMREGGRAEREKDINTSERLRSRLRGGFFIFYIHPFLYKGGLKGKI